MRAARRARILGDADLGQGRCLEIGPLANPVVSPDVADVRYVDVVDRAGLVAHYDGNPAVDPDAIPEQHYWLTRPDGTVSTLAEAVAEGAPFQHVVASHVIEHVPDMLGWLRDVAQVLTWDGALLLAVPDRRYCFDVHRSPTTVGQVVQAHLDGDRTPSVRAVLDHFMRAVDLSAEQAWAGVQPPTQGLHPIDDVRRHLARQQAGDYVDCHVWPLTPRGFADLMDDLLALGQVDFAVERLTATRVGEQEFYATLRRLDRRREPEVAAEEARAALGRLRAELPDESPAARDDDLVPAHQLADVEQRLAETRERLTRVRAARDRARRQRDRAVAAGSSVGADRPGVLTRLERRLRRP
ncbi:methyltransferase domain-containing protein [uncultured Nocardioides sp.]|uniref:class I SAM-dependent methyltransferase n=1 Tax=uncultured Nocardioides sp. TaxID=198441 RepID=UPI0026051045|nr:methyltransferase domain-containing protein [uncultured Nocardioides sp.]